MTPTEADLIELENVVLAGWEVRADQREGFYRDDRIVATLQALIAMARAKNGKKV